VNKKLWTKNSDCPIKTTVTQFSVKQVVLALRNVRMQHERHANREESSQSIHAIGVFFGCS
jgi:hypothetical protein